LAPSPLVSSD